MRLYVGITDREWFGFLRDLNATEVNFWRPRNTSDFKAINTGDVFLFKTKVPENKIVGGAVFVKHTVLPLDMAWYAFGSSNGVASLKAFQKKIQAIRGDSEANPLIGCTILAQPFYFPDYQFQPPPADWAGNIVTGKTYDTNKGEGMRLFDIAKKAIQQANILVSDSGVVDNDIQRFGKGIFVRPRIGQGGFRALVLDEYQRKCAITGEKTMPVLEAAHIVPYSENGIHDVTNGMLMRADFHKLFDKGYVTVGDDLKIYVSSRIRKEFSNGKEYYAYDKRELCVLPESRASYPNPEFLRWHQSHVFLG